MDEMISRQIAIEALKICDTNEDGKICHICPMRDKRWDGAWEDNETICYKKLMRDSAKLLAQPGWIPVTEQLPDVRQWVLCQCRAGIMDVLRLTADGSWSKNYPHTEYMSSFVVAWMPLPAPWEGDANG